MASSKLQGRGRDFYRNFPWCPGPCWLRGGLAAVLAVGLLLAAAAPALDRAFTAHTVRAQVGRIGRGATAASSCAPGQDGNAARALGPAWAPRAARLDAVLSSWQTVGGCGASAATGGGVGVKWIGRGVSGGAFNVQCQVNYSTIAGAGGTLPEKHYALNTLLTKDLGDWVMGANVPYVYKYLDNPFGTDVDLSNGGWGDVSVQLARKLGPINATQLTAIVGLPTARFDDRYKMKLLRQHQQLGFGKVTAALAIDHTLDQLWGQALLGGVASWRGGENSISNYRVPSASGYGFVGYFLGPFVPALGLSVTGFAGHDRDQGEDENTGLFSTAANASIEWSTSWIALQLGASLPYQYDGIVKDSNGAPKSPWGWGSWIVALGVWVAP